MLIMVFTKTVAKFLLLVMAVFVAVCATSASTPIEEEVCEEISIDPEI
jgi:hypothetical protein